jgi:ubiquinone/menaquinone biosynthesis C-methylase UbiE
MKNSEEIKNTVREKYSQIALQDREYNAASCCGGTNASEEVYNIMTDDYSQLDGYNSDADLGLGCGLPTAFAGIKEGDTVVDLGSGAGNDCFVARHEIGDSGKVIGIDFAEPMINKARLNARKLGYNNVEFRLGDLEDMPILEDEADVVVSNCVLNLVPNKTKVINEIFRVLKPDGHFSISDVVIIGELPDAIKSEAEMYVGCVAGAIGKYDYLQKIEDAGFRNIQVQKEKAIVIPDDIMSKYLSEAELAEYKTGAYGIHSVTVYAEKPGDGKSKSRMAELTVVAEDNGGCGCGPGCC